MTLRRHLALAAAALGLAGCPATLDDPAAFLDGGAHATADGGACGDVPSAVLAPKCATAGCHGATAPAGALDLASLNLASRLAGKTASNGALLVDPASPDTSVLLAKTSAAPPFGARMPIGGAPLDDATRACVRAWIASLPSSAAPAPPPADAGTTTDATSPPDAAAPVAPTLANAVVWLDAGRGVTLAGARVSAWTDGTSSHNDAHQTTDANRPTLVMSAIAGRPALRFEEARGTFLEIADAASLQFGTRGFTIAIVAANRKKTVGRGHGGGVSTVVGKPQLPNTAPEIAFHLNWFTSETTDDGTKFHFGVGEGLPGIESAKDGYGDGSAHVFAARVTPANGMTMELRVDGNVAGTSSGGAVDVSLVGQPFRIGSTYGQSVEGDVAEVVIVRGEMATADLVQLETYFRAKYTLSK